MYLVLEMRRPFIEVHLKLKDETPFFCKTLPYARRTKESYTKGNRQIRHLGIIQKGLTGYSSLDLLVKRKNQNLYRVCSDFQILNENY